MSNISNAVALKTRSVQGVVALGLFVLLIGLKTDQNIRTNSSWCNAGALLALVVAITMAVRFVMSAFVAPALAARKAAKAAHKVVDTGEQELVSRQSWQTHSGVSC